MRLVECQLRPDLPQRDDQQGRGADRPEAVAADRTDRRPVRPPERGEVGEQPVAAFADESPCVAAVTLTSPTERAAREGKDVADVVADAIQGAAAFGSAT